MRTPRLIRLSTCRCGSPEASRLPAQSSRDRRSFCRGENLAHCQVLMASCVAKRLYTLSGTRSLLIGGRHVACCVDSAASGCRCQRHADGRGCAADIYSWRPSDSSPLPARRAASESGSVSGRVASAAILPSISHSGNSAANIAASTCWRASACRLPRPEDAVCGIRGSSCTMRAQHTILVKLHSGYRHSHL